MSSAPSDSAMHSYLLLNSIKSRKNTATRSLLNGKIYVTSIKTNMTVLDNTSKSAKRKTGGGLLPIVFYG